MNSRQKQASPPHQHPALPIAECAVCGTATHSIRVRLLEGARLASCGRCQSWTYFPRPKTADQTAIHDSEDYFSHPYFELRRTITPALRRRCRATFDRIGRAVDLSSLRGERVLDIGCDTGAFLACAAAEYGIVPVGIDVADRAVQTARQGGIEAYRTTVETAPAALGDFQLVTAIDVIEHVPDPGAFLHAVLGRLRPGGVVYLETPNIRSTVYSVGARLSGWGGSALEAVCTRLFPPQHLQYFCKQSLGEIAERAGFDVISIETRILPGSDISAGAITRAGLSALQALDRLFGDSILLCAVLRATHNVPQLVA